MDGEDWVFGAPHRLSFRHLLLDACQIGWGCVLELIAAEEWASPLDIPLIYGNEDSLLDPLVFPGKEHLPHLGC